MDSNYLLLSEVFPPKTGGSGRWFWDLYSRLDPDRVIVLTDEVENAQAKVEVWPESALPHGLLKIVARCSDDAGAHPKRLSPSEAFERAIVEDSQQFRL